MPSIHNNPQRRCIGFGQHQGKCTNMAGTPWTDFWCTRCDEMRREAITLQFADIQKRLSEQRSDA